MSPIYLENLGAVGRQAVALGKDAKSAINSALLKGAKIITKESKVRVPVSAKHRGGRGRSSRHLAEVLKATQITGRNTSGVTVEGGANGPSFYWKYVEHGTRKMDARKFVAKSAEARESEVVDTIAEELKASWVYEEVRLLDATILVDELLQDRRLVSLLAVDPFGNPAVYQILAPEGEIFPRIAVFEDTREYTRFADDVPIEERVAFRIGLYARENILYPLNTALHEVMRSLGFRRAAQVEDGYIEDIDVYVKSVTYEILDQLPLPWEE